MTTASTCWQCGAATPPELHCGACRALQPSNPRLSPFARLALPTSFSLAHDDVERAWLLASRRVHPDRYAQKSDKERRYAVEHTTAINSAYQAISDPYNRAQVLLAQAGVTSPAATQQLLLALMEAREAADESDAEKQRVIAESTARFSAIQQRIAAQLHDEEQDAAAYSRSNQRLLQVGAALAEQKMLARLVLDLGGRKLISTLDGRD